MPGMNPPFGRTKDVSGYAKSDAGSGKLEDYKYNLVPKNSRVTIQLAGSDAAQEELQEVMAEELRVFGGVRLECAQCHNHPFEGWSQDQFWGLAAFFSRVFKMVPGNIRRVCHGDPVGTSVTDKAE